MLFKISMSSFFLDEDEMDFIDEGVVILLGFYQY